MRQAAAAQRRTGQRVAASRGRATCSAAPHGATRCMSQHAAALRVARCNMLQRCTLRPVGFSVPALPRNRLRRSCQGDRRLELQSVSPHTPSRAASCARAHERGHGVLRLRPCHGPPSLRAGGPQSESTRACVMRAAPSPCQMRRGSPRAVRRARNGPVGSSSVQRMLGQAAMRCTSKRALGRRRAASAAAGTGQSQALLCAEPMLCQSVGSPLATPAPGLRYPGHNCPAGTGLTPAASAMGLGSPVPHAHAAPAVEVRASSPCMDSPVQT